MSRWDEVEVCVDLERFEKPAAMGWLRRVDVDKLRIGDIASHRLNLGVNVAFREKWNVNLRTNWVGARKTLLV